MLLLSVEAGPIVLAAGGTDRGFLVCVPIERSLVRVVVLMLQSSCHCSRSTEGVSRHLLISLPCGHGKAAPISDSSCFLLGTPVVEGQTKDGACAMERKHSSILMSEVALLGFRVRCRRPSGSLLMYARARVPRSDKAGDKAADQHELKSSGCHSLTHSLARTRTPLTVTLDTTKRYAPTHLSHSLTRCYSLP